MGRILGIDFGDRWIGLALSDPGGIIASPLDVLDGEAALRDALGRLVREKEIERLVVGLPVNMDGTLGPRAKRTLLFKERLEKEWSLPVDTWDERLTTIQAENALRQGTLSGAKRRMRVDKVAAQILLQSYLDRQRALNQEGSSTE